MALHGTIWAVQNCWQLAVSAKHDCGQNTSTTVVVRSGRITKQHLPPATICPVCIEVHLVGGSDKGQMRAMEGRTCIAISLGLNQPDAMAKAAAN